jgi:hypothetical protein
MLVSVRMRLGNWTVMLVLMVFIMKVEMFMKHKVMRVQVAVPLTK